MSTRGLAFKYVAGQLRGDRDSMVEQGRGTNTVHAGHHGALVRIHSEAPPPVGDYDQWLAAQATEKTKHGHTSISGGKLRRAVLMRRSGCGLAEIGRAIGASPSTVCKWLGRLPEGLAA